MKYLPLFIFVLGIQNLQAQRQKAIVNESFDNNDKKWTVQRNMDYVSSIQDGQYQLTSKKESYKIIINNLYIDYKSDFEIEASFEYLDGTGQYGLVWGRQDHRSFELFVIDRSAWGVANLDLRQKNFPTLRHTDVIKTQNLLSIKAHKGEVSYWINQKEVFRKPIPKMRGLALGFYTKGRVHVAVEHLAIIQDQEINLVDNSPTEIIKENIKAMNSQYVDSGVMPSADGKTLYFARTGDPSNIGTTLSDIYVASLDANNQWGNVRKLGRPLNNPGANYVIAVSADEKMMIIGNAYNEEGAPDGGGLSITHRTKDGGWEIPTRIYIARQYNRSKYSEYALSPDFRVLLSSVQRDDSQGSKDIYVSFLQKDGSWSMPKNIGKVVNTIGNEVSPFIAADGKTLYYSTDGFPGYGSHDVFVTKRLDDTWLRWSKPKNLGPAINTQSFDAYYTVSADGKYAYMVTTTPDNQEDIFRIYLPESLQTETNSPAVKKAKEKLEVLRKKILKKEAKASVYKDFS